MEFKLAGFADSEHDQIVGILVGRDEKISGGINGKISRRFALSGLALDERERSLRAINAEDGDAVMAAVGAVEKLARGMHGHFGANVVALEIIRQRVDDRLDFDATRRAPRS